MTRLFAFAVAVILTLLTFSSTCLALGPVPLRFAITPSRISDSVQVRFERDREGRSQNDWDSSFRVSELSGLDLAALDGTTARPIHFAIVREPGRIDCAGTGAGAVAHGTCSASPDAGFLALLSRHGIGQPNEDQLLGLIALNVHRNLIEALAAARFPTPSVGQLIALTAVGVTPEYIRGLGAAGYRPQTLDGLVQFAALKITPEFIGSYIRAGYSGLHPEELIQLKAMNITPDFIAGFERIGYRHLPVETLVQLKALNITPEFVRSVQQGGPLPSPERLVELRTVGRDSGNH
jgi:hypothetical protein